MLCHIEFHLQSRSTCIGHLTSRHVPALSCLRAVDAQTKDAPKFPQYTCLVQHPSLQPDLGAVQHWLTCPLRDLHMHRRRVDAPCFSSSPATTRVAFRTRPAAQPRATGASPGAMCVPDHDYAARYPHRGNVEAMEADWHHPWQWCRGLRWQGHPDAADIGNAGCVCSGLLAGLHSRSADIGRARRLPIFDWDERRRRC